MDSKKKGDDMVIFNGKEIAAHEYIHGRIIEINTRKSLDEAIEDLKSGPLPESDYFVMTRQIVKPDGQRPVFTPLVPQIPETSAITGSYKTVLTAGQLEAAEDAAAIYVRPPEFEEYEKANFNQPTEWAFEEVQITDSELRDELLAAAGVVPTLLGEDLPLDELKRKSAVARQLYRSFEDEGHRTLGLISRDNPVPTLALINAFEDMDVYERRAITRGTVHPRKAFDIARAYKEVTGGGFFTEEMVDKIEAAGLEKRQVTRDQFVEEFTSFSREHADLLEVYSAAFAASRHKRAPRVLSQYVEGALAARGIDPSSNKAKDQGVVSEIVEAFDLKSVSRVAKYKSPVLLALSEHVAFGSVRESLISVLASSMKMSQLREAFRKGFPQWLSKHTDVNPSEVSQIFSREGGEPVLAKISRFDENRTATEIMEAAKNSKADEDRVKYERKYGYSFSNNEVAIKGRNTVVKQGNLTMRMLRATELKNFTVGYDTHCCQHFGNAGETCVWKYTTDPFAAVVVIERGDRVIAQGFVFTDEALSTLVFDNVEFDNDREVSTFNDLFAAFAAAMPYKNVHIGVGYNQGMAGWGKKVKYNAAMPTTLSSNRVYSDYHSDARSLKTNGRMEIVAKSAVKVETRPDEPTKWDELAKPDLAFMLNDCSKSPEERLRVAREFRENPTPELQMEIVRAYPAAVASLDEPCREAQLYILSHNPDLASQIKNPCVEVQSELLRRDPSYIRSVENPSHELKLEVLSKNGMLLEHFASEATPEEVLTAVSQNGYAVQFVPSDKRTIDVMVAAARKSPKTVSMMPEATEEVVRAAVDVNPMVFPLIAPESMTPELQVYAVQRHPSLINMIPDPCRDAVVAAVERNGLLIRNFQHRFPELREVALRQNGYAIRCLSNPTPDEVRIAVMQNPAAASAVKSESVLAEVAAEPVLDEVEIG